MTRKIASFIAVLLLGISLLACEQNDPERPVQFPQDLYLHNVNKTSAIRLFTNQTEITDPTVIAAFTANSSFFTLQDQPVDTSTKMTFLMPDSATFGISGIKFSANKTGERWLFYSDLPINERPADALLFGMMKYRYPSTPHPDPAWGNITREVRVGYGDYHTLSLALTGFKLHQRDGVYYSSKTAGVLYNEFNEEVIAWLGPTDTLAIQEFSMTLKARE